MLWRFLAISLVTLSSVPLQASELSCGDHWFSWRLEKASTKAPANLQKSIGNFTLEVDGDYFGNGQQPASQPLTLVFDQVSAKVRSFSNSGSSFEILLKSPIDQSVVRILKDAAWESRTLQFCDTSSSFLALLAEASKTL